MIQTTPNRRHTMFQEPPEGAERLRTMHEFTLVEGEHVEGCLACSESFLYEHWRVELREDGERIGRVSPVPPPLHPINQQHVEECHDCYWALIRQYTLTVDTMPWA